MRELSLTSITRLLLAELLAKSLKMKEVTSDDALRILSRACIFDRKQLATEASKAYFRGSTSLDEKNPLLRAVPAEGLFLLVKRNPTPSSRIVAKA